MVGSFLKPSSGRKEKPIHSISKQYSIQTLERVYKHYFFIIRGRREEKKETAINLSRMGMSEELIARAVNASEDQVRDWLSEMYNAVR